MPNLPENHSKKSRGHIVTVLLQDYFHRGVFKQVVGEKQWSRFESRLDKNVDDVLNIFDTYDIKATFFTLGWIADQKTEIIKRIACEGHEIGCSGYFARSIGEMTVEQFREDLNRSRKSLEQAGANKIIGYRSAYKWLRDKDFWVLDILSEEGLVYDASYRPISIGSKEKSLGACELKTKNGKIWEFPASSHSILGFNLPISGGSYLRLLPHKTMFRWFKDWIDNIDDPFVLYFHPWELDTTQPEITAVGRISRVKQYRNLGKMNWILPKYFEEGNFLSISQYLNIPLEYPDTSVSGLQHPTINLTDHKSISNLEPRTSNLTQGAFSPTPNISGSRLQPPTSNLIPGVQHLTPITVVIPCYNESSSLPYLTKALEELILEGTNKYSFKFLFVDDCSKDDTVAVIKKIFGCNESCRILRHANNKGIAAAIQTGIKAADTEIVCSMDADCSYDPLELLNMIPLLKDDVDLVTASPYHRDGFVIGVPEWRLFLSKSLSKIYHLFLRNKLATYTSCFRVYQRKSVLTLKLEHGDYRGIIELLTQLDFGGKIIEEYPTTLHSRIFGHSKMKVLITMKGHLILLAGFIKYRGRYQK